MKFKILAWTDLGECSLLPVACINLTNHSNRFFAKTWGGHVSITFLFFGAGFFVYP